MEVITYEIQQQVKVRKYNVDCKKLCDLLRKHKKMASLSNKEIAETLNMPITKVEHWFRQDSCFSIPDECIWFELKKLLKITNNEFDLAITTFEEKDNVFEKGNRIYDSQGICPTITCLDSLVVLDRSYEMEVMKLFDIPKEVINDNERQRRVYSVEGISPTVLSRSDNAKIMEVKVIGQMDNTIDHTFERANRVYDVGGVSPTINTCGGGGLQPKIIDEVMRIGNLSDTKTQSRTVYKSEGISPTLCSGMDHGNTMPHILDKTIVAMRGRNPDNPSDRTVGAPTEQRLEPNSQGLCNTLTSVQKDNLVMETVIIDDTYANRQPRVYEDYCPTLRSEREGLKTVETISTKGKQIEVASTILAGYERTNMTGFNADNGVIETVKIKQATSQGYIECEVGGVADLSFPDSKTRRGRVQENGQVSPTLMAGEQDICRICAVDEQNMNLRHHTFGTLTTDGSSPKHNNRVMEYTTTHYRIRKLTPKECWRLMDFTDKDFEKAAQANSNTQLYRQAGNSIPKNLLVAIFGQMLPGKENIYKEN